MIFVITHLCYEMMGVLYNLAIKEAFRMCTNSYNFSGRQNVFPSLREVPFAEHFPHTSAIFVLFSTSTFMS